jgi:hypothetical protein
MANRTGLACPTPRCASAIHDAIWVEGGVGDDDVDASNGTTCVGQELHPQLDCTSQYEHVAARLHVETLERSYIA